MAVWDLGFFDNDMACDWENGITEDTTLDYIKTPIEALLNESEDDIDKSCKALAACEALVKLGTKSGESSTYTEHLDNWVKRFCDIIPNSLIISALESIEQIKANGSELKLYWTLRGESNEWTKRLNDLIARLKRVNE